ncbi:hypothetical protein [Sphingobacterium cellulitidis]|uniref:hypothetical protein n=1 Tax=Sphingobacterium cellulitidis TaxID=1768011 RepID=UPI000B93EF22|nr:hypothetical protein CHT99_03505 [Sphingobacterium cellulitidis]
MKKSIIILALLPLLFIGCKKGGHTNDPMPEEHLFDVKFSASAFDQEIKPMNVKSTTKNTSTLNKIENPQDKFNSLIYLIYDENGKKVSEGRNYVYEEKYEDALNFNLKLPKGKYSIILAGVDTNPRTEGKIEDIYFYGSINNVFCSDIVKIGVDSDSTYSPIKLSRITSTVKVDITDVSPDEEVTLELKGNLYKGIYPFGTNNYESANIQSISKLKVLPKSVNNVFEIVLFPQKLKEASSVNLEIIIYNKSNVIIGTKSIPGVIIKSNHKTILTGKVFDVLESKEKKSTFKAEIVGNYSSDIINQTF